MKIVRSFFTHPLISGSTIVFIGSMMVNVLNYLFYLAMGRTLSVSDYGLLVTLINSLALFGIFSSTFTGIFAKFTASYIAKDNKEGLARFLGGGLRFVLLFSACSVIVLLLGTSIISSFLHITDLRLLFITFILIGSTICASIYMGLFQGQMRFYLLSFLNALSPILKIILSLLAVILGYKLLGVFFALFLSGIIPLCIGFFLLNKSFQKKHEGVKAFLHEIKHFGPRFFLSSLSVTIFTSLDIILVRHFFSPVIAGQYAALSLMGKAIFYLTSPIYFVFFPLIAQKKEKKEKVFGTLILAIGLISVSSLFLSAIYFLFPDLILRIFFPAKAYQDLRGYLGFYSLYIFAFSLAGLLNNFYLSLGKTEVYKLNLGCGLLFITLLSFFHSSLLQVISVLFIVALALLVLLLVYFRYYERD